MIKRLLDYQIDDCISRFRTFNNLRIKDFNQSIAVAVEIDQGNSPVECTFRLKIKDSRRFINRHPQAILKGKLSVVDGQTLVVAKYTYSPLAYFMFLQMILIPVIAYFVKDHSFHFALSALLTLILLNIVYGQYAKQHRRILAQALDCILEDNRFQDTD